MESWRLLSNQWERLRWARLHKTEFTRVKDAAESLNLKPGTYRTYEHEPGADGGRLPALSELQRICRKYKVSWVWVATGEGSPDDASIVDERAGAITDKLGQVPADKQADALSAAMAVLESYARKAG